MFMRKSTKITLLCLCAAILFSIIVSISRIPRRISQEFSGVKVFMANEDEMEILQTVDIRIEGRLYRGLFAGHPVFRGLFEISDRWYTIGNTNQIHFFNGFGERDVDRMGAWFSYWTQELVGVDLRTEFHHVGFLHTDARFSSVVIVLSETVPTDPVVAQRADGGTITVSRPQNLVIAAPAADIGSVREVFSANALEWLDIVGAPRSMR